MGRRGLAVAVALAAGAAAAGDSGAEMGETLVITATRAPQAASDAPTPVEVIGGTQVRDSKALDEALRADPSFAAFRRSSSLVADPSSQGVNLRGIGPSGVSRALVLEDGVPANDGFGGWVYWGAVPRLSLDRVEIAPGASSALYGSAALGGVVQLVSRPIDDRAEFEVQGGSFGTADGALSVGRRTDAFAAALDAEGLTTRGYGVVASPGPVDHDASSRHASARLRLEAPMGGFIAWLRAGAYDESEDGGTLFTTAAARQGELALGLTGHDLEMHLFGRLSRFDQQRGRVQPDRSAATLASTQSAPADDDGLSILWRPGGGFTLGADARRMFGQSLETPASGPEVRREGEQREGGVFAEQLVTFDRLEVQAALRADGWTSAGATRGAAPVSRSDAQLSPRLAARVKALPWLALRAAAYRSFRAPTLNELYRPFQVGPVRTDANPQLGPESLLGAEAGVDLGTHLTATAFVARLEHPIVNATVGPNLQLRENLGEARIGGLEVRAHWRPLPPLRLDAGYTYVATRVAGAAQELPQDPRHRLSLGAAYAGWLTAEAHLRWTSDQFEDDLNTLRLPGYAVLDAMISRQLSQRWTLFIAAENLLDRRYLVGLQGGVATIGQPFCIRAGARFTAP